MAELILPLLFYLKECVTSGSPQPPLSFWLCCSLCFFLAAYVSAVQMCPEVPPSSVLEARCVQKEATGSGVPCL